MLVKDRRLLESLTRKYGKKNIYDIISLNEDSLDDFDINGNYARARANTSQVIKNKIHKLLNKNYEKIVNACNDFFKEKGMNMTLSKHTDRNSFKVYFPELNWSFTYNIKSSVSYKIIVGRYGNIGGNRVYSENVKLMKELGTYIANNIKGLYFDSNSPWCVRETSVGEIYSGAYVMSISAKLNELRLNNKRKQINPLTKWFNKLSIEELELITGYDLSNYKSENDFYEECEKWWTNLTPTKQERYYNKFDKVFQRMKN